MKAPDDVHILEMGSPSNTDSPIVLKSAIDVSEGKDMANKNVIAPARMYMSVPRETELDINTCPIKGVIMTPIRIKQLQMPRAVALTFVG